MENDPAEIDPPYPDFPGFQNPTPALQIDPPEGCQKPSIRPQAQLVYNLFQHRLFDDHSKATSTICVSIAYLPDAATFPG